MKAPRRLKVALIAGGVGLLAWVAVVARYATYDADHPEQDLKRALRSSDKLEISNCFGVTTETMPMHMDVGPFACNFIWNGTIESLMDLGRLEESSREKLAPATTEALADCNPAPSADAHVLVPMQTPKANESGNAGLYAVLVDKRAIDHLVACAALL